MIRPGAIFILASVGRAVSAAPPRTPRESSSAPQSSCALLRRTAVLLGKPPVMLRRAAVLLGRPVVLLSRAAVLLSRAAVLLGRTPVLLSRAAKTGNEKLRQSGFLSLPFAFHLHFT